jgi:Putative beta-lactamase-inhibitor-like, PepSY-like
MVNEIRIRYGGAALLSLITILIALACGDDPYTPDNPDVVKRLYTLYPDVKDITWSMKGEYFVADCWDGNNELDVWISSNAEWVMTEMEIFRSQIPASVNTSFINGKYADWSIKNMTELTFPVEPAVMFVIEVQKDSREMALYYSEYGSLMQSVDITDADYSHWANVSGILPAS